MNSSLAHSTGHKAATPRAFILTEWIALPFAISVMVAQVTLVVGLRAAPILPDRSNLFAPSLILFSDAVYIFLLLLCFWFALLVRAIDNWVGQHILAQFIPPLLFFVWGGALLVGSIVVTMTFPPPDGDVASAATRNFFLVGFFFFIGIFYCYGSLGRGPARHNLLLTGLRVGLLLLAITPLLSALTTASGMQEVVILLLRAQLAFGVPFVVSGCIALALTRLNTLSQTRAVMAATASGRRDGRNRWYAIVAPWGLLAIALSLLLGLLAAGHIRPGSSGSSGSSTGGTSQQGGNGSGPYQPGTQGNGQQPHLDPRFFLLLAAIVLGLILLGLFIWLGVWLWRRRRARGGVGRADGAVSALAVSAADLEDSVRAYYRRFLGATSAVGEPLARLAAETPAEYAQRLTALMATPNSPLHPTTGGSETLETRAILDELTRAYSLERYGSEPVEEPRRARLRGWLPHLLAAAQKKAPR